MKDTHISDDAYILKDLTPSSLEKCIKSGRRDVFFFHNGELLSINDEDRINALEEGCLAEKQYSQLKELNQIRTLSCVVNKESFMKSFPSHIQLEHTTFCNARCIMCDHYVAHNRGSKHLTVKDLDPIRHLLPYASMIIMHGNGEPLINPCINELLDVYRSYNILVSMNTNLSYLTDDILHNLRTVCKSIHVSCDGIDKYQYEGIRQGLNFDVFMANLHKLTENRGDIDLSLDVVLMRQNISSAGEFVKLADKFGIKRVYLNALGVNKLIGNYEDSLSLINDKAVYYCEQARNIGERCGVKVITPYEGMSVSSDFHEAARSEQIDYPDPERSNILHAQNPLFSNTIAHEAIDEKLLVSPSARKAECGICEYPFFKVYISIDGKVSYCCPLSRKYVGSLRESSFDEIWNGHYYKRMREAFYSGIIPACCDDCYFLDNNSVVFLQHKRDSC